MDGIALKSAERDSVTAEILSQLADAGFALAGICDAKPIDRPHAFAAWLAEGHHGQMHYLAKHVSKRVDPSQLVEDAKSIICVADCYSDGKPDERRVDHERHGRIARYARGRDYHRVLRERLEPIAQSLRLRFPGERFRVCVDTAPIAERDHAVRAGLGRIGKHTLLIGDHGVGSWLVLGEIVTTLHLTPTPSRDGDPCGSCTRCIDACPTQAIEPWKVKAERCISYLTIEHEGEPAEWFRNRADDWLFGCDACIEACPHSQWTLRARETPIRSDYAATHGSFELDAVARWTEEERINLGLSEVLLRASLASWKRNAELLVRKQA